MKAAAAAPLAGLLAASLLIGCERSRRAEPPAVTRIEFQEGRDSERMVAGWSGFERTEDGLTFAWAVGTSASVRLGPESRMPHTIELRAWAFDFPGAPPQVAVVFVNGCRVAELRLSPAPSDYAIATPWSVWTDGTNMLSFAFSRADAPRDRVAGATDERLLSVGFDRILLRPGAVTE